MFFLLLSVIFMIFFHLRICFITSFPMPFVLPSFRLMIFIILILGMFLLFMFAVHVIIEIIIVLIVVLSLFVLGIIGIPTTVLIFFVIILKVDIFKLSFLQISIETFLFFLFIWVLLFFLIFQSIFLLLFPLSASSFVGIRIFLILLIFWSVVFLQFLKLEFLFLFPFFVELTLEIISSFPLLWAKFIPLILWQHFWKIMNFNLLLLLIAYRKFPIFWDVFFLLFFFINLFFLFLFYFLFCLDFLFFLWLLIRHFSFQRW